MIENTSNKHLLFADGSPFTVLDEKARLELTHLIIPRNFSSGEFVHRAGDPAKEIFCVLSGKVRFSSSNSDGGYVLVQDINPGEWFGFMGYFGEGKRPQDATAQGTSRVAYLKGTDLDALLDRYPQIYRTFLRQMATYSTDFFTNYFNAVNLSLRSRIIQMLLKLSQWQSSMDLSTTQADLASLLGATREAVGVHLNELQKQGSIRLGYKQILLLDIAALENMIEP